MGRNFGRNVFNVVLATQLLVGGMVIVPKAMAQEQPSKSGAASKRPGDNEIAYRDPELGIVLTRGAVRKMKGGEKILKELQRIDAGGPALIGGVTKTDEEIVRLGSEIKAIREERAALEKMMKQKYPQP